MAKLIVSPDQIQYKISQPAESLSARVNGGLSRSRRDIVKATSRLQTVWILDGLDFRYFWSFYETNKDIQFTIDLILDEATPTEYNAHFIPNSLSIEQVYGGGYQVASGLEVSPVTPVDFTAEAAIVTARQALPLKLVLRPERTSYRLARDGNEVVSSELEGGVSFFSRNLPSSPSRAKVSWKLNATDYRYLRAFYHTTKGCSLPFLMDLIHKEPILTSHRVKIVPGTFSFDGLSGITYNVSAELDIIPTTRVNRPTTPGVPLDSIPTRDHQIVAARTDPLTAPVITLPLNDATVTNPITVTGTAQRNVYVHLYRDGVLVGTTLSDGDGNWSISGLSI